MATVAVQQAIANKSNIFFLPSQRTNISTSFNKDLRILIDFQSQSPPVYMS
jgi:hypothetical protein